MPLNFQREHGLKKKSAQKIFAPQQNMWEI